MADEHSNELSTTAEPDSHADREIIVPLLMEEMSVSKRVVPKGRVRVSRVTGQHEELVDELLAREHVEIERTPIDSPVDAMPRCAKRETQSSFPSLKRC
jgi:stress response protein YsnF